MLHHLLLWIWLLEVQTRHNHPASLVLLLELLLLLLLLLHHLLLLLDLLTLVEPILVLLFVHVVGVIVISILILPHLWATKLIILKPVLRARHNISIASVVVLSILIASICNEFRLFGLLMLLLLKWYRRWWLLLLLEILLLLQLMLLQVICLIVHGVLFDTLVLLWIIIVKLLLLSLLGHLRWAWLSKLSKSYAVVVIVRIIKDVDLVSFSVAAEVCERIA